MRRYTVNTFSKVDEIGIRMYKSRKRPKQALAGSTGTAAG